MSKKIIGITGLSAYSPQIRSMVEKFFGAIPLDIMQNGRDDIERVASFCDAIILAGGVDIYPLNLPDKRELTRGCGYSRFDQMRDRREKILLDVCAEQGKKVLGICRGHQMLLSLAGLYLMPDITHGDVIHNPRDIEVNDEPIHYVEGVGKGKTEFFEMEGVNSFHHQAIRFDGIKEAFELGVEVLGIADVTYQNGRVESEQIIELARGRNNNFISCQWHPEVDWENVEPSKMVLEAFKKMIS